MASDAPATGREKRAYSRIPLRLSVEVWGAAWPARQAKVRDFCPGGIFVSCDRYENDPEPIGQVADPGSPTAQVTVRCPIPDDSGRVVVHELEARVARAFEAGLGLSFVDPDPLAIGMLEGLSARQLAEQSKRTGRNQQITPARQAEIRAACRTLSRSELEAALVTFYRRAERALLEAARETKSSITQQSLFDGIEAWNKRTDTISKRFLELIDTHFEELGAPLAAVEPAPDEQTGTSDLRLVDKDDFEDFLIVSDIVTKAELAFDVTLFEIDRRLEHVADRRIGNENNPVGPLALCHAFRSALSGLPVEHLTIEVIYQSFSDFVLGSLGSFYWAINRQLELAGLGTESRFKGTAAPPTPIIRGTQSRGRPGADGQSAPVSGAAPHPTAGPPLALSTNEGAPAASSAPSETPPPAGAPSGVEPVPAGSGGPGAVGPGVAGAGVAGPGAAGPGVAGPGVAGPGGAGAVVPAAPPGVVAGDATGAFGGVVARSVAAPAHQIGAPVAFGAAQSLLDIRRRQTHHGLVSAGQSVPSGSQYALDDVLGAVARIQTRFSQASSDGESTGAFKDELMSVLTSQSGAAEKVLADGVTDSIDLVEGLFGAMARDARVPDAVKRRIARVQPVVQRVALVEPSFLSVRDHPVRRLLNALGELDVASPGADGASGLEEAVDPAIEWLLSATEPHTGALAASAVQVEALVEVQRASSEAEKARVIKMCEDQEAFVKQRRAAEGRALDDSSTRPDSAPSKEWAVWLSRAKRLNTAAYLDLMESGSKSKQRVQLAWIGEGFNPFVFVNKRGEKVSNLSLQELAMYLRRGQAVLIERAEMPLVDRALYALLHRVHGQIGRNAGFDDATGLGTRRTLIADLEAALRETSQDHDLEHALGGLEVEGLDAVELRHGLAARSAVLRGVADAMRAFLGEDVQLTRGDGDRFLFLVSDTSARRMRRTGQRLRRGVEDRYLEIAGERYFPKVRVGVCLISCVIQHAERVLELVNEALDTSPAPSDGVTVVEPEEDVHDEARQMVDWAAVVERSLAEDRMQLRYQLVSPFDDKAKPYFEVLLGLLDDEGQAIPTLEFLDAVRFYEQQAALDRWVIRNCLKWMAANRGPVRKAAGFTIKLTAQSLADDKLMEYLLEQLTATAVPPGKICLELTERDATEHPEEAGRLVRTLREFGCRFSLAKFSSGEGVSLESLPVDFIKFDGRYVQQMLSSDDDLAVIQSANELAHASGLRTVAEFVEEAAVLVKLQALGVDYAQGIGVDAPRYLSELGPAPSEEPVDDLADIASVFDTEPAPDLPDRPDRKDGSGDDVDVDSTLRF